MKKFIKNKLILLKENLIYSKEEFCAKVNVLDKIRSYTNSNISLIFKTKKKFWLKLR